MKKSVPLVVGNWKLNPVSLEAATTLASALAKKIKKLESPYVAVAPSFPHLAAVEAKLAKSAIALAAQDVSVHGIGAYTGEVSVLQLKDLKSKFIIIGHSERRAAGESDEEVQQKVLVTLKHNLTPIICVGESNRDEQGNFFSFVEEQLRSLGKVLTATQVKKVVIAYEPIWAIGTGNTATAADVKEMQLFIESVLTKIYNRPTARAIRLIYGGSVKPQNALELHRDGGMNGFLVGGASLKAEDYLEIIKAVR